MADKSASLSWLRAIILFISITVYACTVLLGFLQGFTDTLQTWHGFYSLLIPANIPLETIHKHLEDGGVSEFVSAKNATIDIGTFGGIKRVGIEQANRQFMAGDPRGSPWLTLVQGLFYDESHSNHIIYVYQKEALANLSLRIQGIFDPAGISWQIVEWNPADRLLVASLIAIAGILAALLAKGIRLPMLAAIVPWAMVALGFGPRLFPLFALLLLAMSFLSEKLLIELHRFVVEAKPRHFFWELLHRPRQALRALKHLGSYAASPGLFLAAAFYVGVSILVLVLCSMSGDGIGAWGVVLLTVICWPAIMVWITYVYNARSRRHDHPLYFPVPILHRYRSRGWSLPVRIAVLGLFSLLIPGLFMLSSSPIRGASIPVPLVNNQPQAITMDNLAKLYTSHFISPKLPDVSLMVNHRLRQEALAWIRPKEWGNRIGNGSLFGLKIAVPAVPEPDQAKSERLVLDANDAWLTNYRKNCSPYSIEGILFSQDQAVGLAYSSVHGVYSVDIWSLTGILVFGLLSILSICIRRTPGFLPGARRHPIWGKKSTL